MLHVVLLVKQIVYDYKKNYTSYNNGLVLIAGNIKFFYCLNCLYE